MVAMTPLIIIQLIGLSYELKTRRANAKTDLLVLDMNEEFIELEKEESHD